MAWIELHDTLPDHDKVLDLSVALKMDKDMVVGKLVRLWTWALDNREDGSFRSRDVATIAEVMRFRGTPQRLVDALVAARLLDVIDDGYVIHNWYERVAMLLARREAKRASNRNRQNRYRAKNRENNALSNVVLSPSINADNAATVPYLIDDDADNDVDLRAYAREGNCDEWDDRYARADQLIKSAIKSSYGRTATPAELEWLSRIFVINDKIQLIDAAIQRAAAYGAKSVASYVDAIVKEWKYYGIDTPAELDQYSPMIDCINGRNVVSMDRSEALKLLDEHRKRKQQ